MKTIALLTVILSVLSFAVGCTQTNSAQTTQNANIAKFETNTNSATNVFSANYRQNMLPSEISNTNTSAVEVEEVDETVEEPGVPKYKIEMLMDSQYYEEEVQNTVGVHRGWLGLYRKKDKYYLMPTTIEVKAVSHTLRDRNDSKEKTGREVSSKIKLPSVFLLKNAKILRQGEVMTVFYGNETDSDSIDRKYRREFDFNGKKYTLFVEDTSDEDGEYLTAKSKMVITDGKTKQTIFESEFCSDCSWNLCWVGDLDNDGKLDFMLNLNSHYNSTCHTLFLSSQAEKTGIVRDVAEVCQMGC